MRFYTSDLHLNSPGSIPWFRRKFSNVYKMNDGLIRNINARLKKTDVLIHVGDFAAVGKEKGIPCLGINPRKHLEKIVPNIILVEGNHDQNNRVPSHLKWMTVDLGENVDLGDIETCDPQCVKWIKTNLGKQYRNVSIGHYPSHDPEAAGQFTNGTVRICGHVHRAWKYYWDQEHDVLNINVGCDVWKWLPISEAELIVYISQLETKLNHKWHRG